jgi:hypothetical protein
MAWPSNSRSAGVRPASPLRVVFVILYASMYDLRRSTQMSHSELELGMSEASKAENWGRAREAPGEAGLTCSINQRQGSGCKGTVG